MLFLLLKLLCLCCASYGDPQIFNPLFHVGNEGFFDPSDVSLEKSFGDGFGGVGVAPFPFQPRVRPGVGTFVGTLNSPFRGIHPGASSRIPVYMDAGRGIGLGSLLGVPSTTTKIQPKPEVSRSKPRTTLSPPTLRPRPFSLSYQSYGKPKAFPVTSNEKTSSSSLKPATYSLSSQNGPHYHAASYQSAIQTGFTPIYNAKRSVFKTLKSPTLSEKKTYGLHTSASTSQSSFQQKPVSSVASRFTALTSVPAEKLALARKSSRTSSASFGTRISSTPLNDTLVKTSYSSSVSTSVGSQSFDDALKTSDSSNIWTVKGNEPVDQLCEGSKDLGWCDLGERYPKSIVHQLLTFCKEFVERTFVEIPHSFAEISEPYQFSSPADNASYREAKERGNHDTWSWASYFSKKGSLCDAEQGFVRPEAAKDSSGTWHIIVQTDDVKQRLPIEMCRKANGSCKKVSDCGIKSQCFQKYSYSHLLSLDPNQVHACPSVKLFKFPSACVCHIE